MFKPIYICDACLKEKLASWAGEPNWEVPEGWTESDKYPFQHFCSKCTRLLKNMNQNQKVKTR